MNDKAIERKARQVILAFPPGGFRFACHFNAYNLYPLTDIVLMQFALTNGVHRMSELTLSIARTDIVTNAARIREEQVRKFREPRRVVRAGCSAIQ